MSKFDNRMDPQCPKKDEEISKKFNEVITKEELAKNVKILRERTDLTQKQIADMLHIERSTYAYYETGKTSPDIFTLIRLSRILDIPIDTFFKRGTGFFMCLKRKKDD